MHCIALVHQSAVDKIRRILNVDYANCPAGKVIAEVMTHHFSVFFNRPNMKRR
ncbi:sugar fermentation stimulation protein [Aggregatibacter aphrophilus NJ8700]|nr:sugar fermentation stimulation protein [Aggregatibacter aphrophilus NJ8700]